MNERARNLKLERRGNPRDRTELARARSFEKESPELEERWAGIGIGGARWARGTSRRFAVDPLSEAGHPPETIRNLCRNVLQIHFYGERGSLPYAEDAQKI